METLPSLDRAQSVLATKIVRRGKDTLSYRLVSPPPNPPAAPPSPRPTVTVNSLAAESTAPAIEPRFFDFNLTSHPYGVQELEWTDEAGRSKRVFVHEDLSYLSPSFTVVVGDETYAFSCTRWGLFSETDLSDHPLPLRRLVERARQLPAGRYFTAPNRDGLTLAPTDAEQDALDVLLSYHQVNRATLKAEHLAAAAKAQAEAEVQRLHDLKHKNIEIRYWPVKSQRYPTSGHQ